MPRSDFLNLNKAPISFARSVNAANGATKNPPREYSAPIRPPQSPSQSKKLYVYLLISVRSLLNSTEKLEYLYCGFGFSLFGNVFQALGKDGIPSFLSL